MPTLLFVTVGSGVLGVILSRLIVPVSTRIEDVSVAVVVQFCSTFGVWMLAERLHLSGILTVVVFAMVTNRRVAGRTSARLRLPSYAVWEFAVYVLNVLAFILVGLQLKAIIGRIDHDTLLDYFFVGSCVTLATIVARLLWVSGATAVSRFRERRSAHGGAADAGVALTKRESAVVGWCGMRGIVTLAAALALPAGDGTTSSFPFRDLILFSAFSVVLGTLVVQGMTLRPLMSLLRVEDDGEVEREVRAARVETLRAALSAVGALDERELSALLRHRYEVMLRRAETELQASGPAALTLEGVSPSTIDGETAAVRQATSAERERLLALRGSGAIGDAAFQQLEHELDLEELHLEHVVGAARS